MLGAVSRDTLEANRRAARVRREGEAEGEGPDCSPRKIEFELERDMVQAVRNAEVRISDLIQQNETDVLEFQVHTNGHCNTDWCVRGRWRRVLEAGVGGGCWRRVLGVGGRQSPGARAHSNTRTLVHSHTRALAHSRTRTFAGGGGGALWQNALCQDYTARTH
jgi:hypothetical protein